MKEKIIKALEAFDSKAVILYDSMNGETVTFKDVISYIECLQREIGCYVADQDVWISGYQGTQKDNERLKAEIERLTEENRRDVFNLNTRICELDNENAELQKQVDELKKQLEDMEEQRDNQAYIAEDLIQEKHRWTEQAVKDRTKEIYQELYNFSKKLSCGSLNTTDIKQIAKDKGVEVE